MSGPVSYERKENIGIITVNNPPVNALSQAVSCLLYTSPSPRD